MKKALLAALVGVGLAIATPALAHAEGCSGAHGPMGNGGSYCDTDFWPDGSYMHCVTVNVFGFGGQQCNRIYPPAPEA